MGPTRIDSVLGVTKAYLTRVGAGPFPSEADEERGTAIREHGAEYGTVTGRDRRCGWLDLVGLRFAARLNGLTELAVTKLDVLSIFDRIPVCTGYRLPDGSVSQDFPAHQSDFHHAAARVRGARGLGRRHLGRPHRRPTCPRRRARTSRSSRSTSGCPWRSSAPASAATRSSTCTTS